MSCVVRSFDRFARQKRTRYAEAFTICHVPTPTKGCLVRARTGDSMPTTSPASRSHVGSGSSWLRGVEAPEPAICAFGSEHRVRRRLVLTLAGLAAYVLRLLRDREEARP